MICLATITSVLARSWSVCGQGDLPLGTGFRSVAGQMRLCDFLILSCISALLKPTLRDDGIVLIMIAMEGWCDFLSRQRKVNIAYLEWWFGCVMAALCILMQNGTTKRYLDSCTCYLHPYVSYCRFVPTICHIQNISRDVMCFGCDFLSCISALLKPVLRDDGTYHDSHGGLMSLPSSRQRKEARR